MVELKNIRKTFENGWLNQINYHFPKTGFYEIIGTKEERKTLLNLIGMEDFDYEGSIFYQNRELTIEESKKYKNENISFFPNIPLEENKSILGNLKSSLEKEEKIKKDLKKFGLENQSRKRIKTLEDKEKKKVMFLKAIEKKAKIYLFDESSFPKEATTKRKVLEMIQEKSKTSLIILGLEKELVLENTKYETIKLMNGNLFTKEKTTPVNQENKKTEKLTVEQEKRQVSILFFGVIFFFLFLSVTFLTINSTQIHYESLIEENSNEIFLKLNGKELTAKEINEIKEKAQISYGITYEETGTFMGLVSQKLVSSKEYPIFYNAIMSIPIFYEIEENSSFDLLIGNLPEKENEILITQTVADFILYKGILTTHQTFFTPKTYEEIIDGVGEISYGGIPTKITGIIKQDLKDYELFKTKKEKELTKKEFFSFQDLSARNAKYAMTYVKPSFKNYIKTYDQNRKIKENVYELRIIANNKNDIKEIIQKCAKENILVESIVSNRIEKYNPIIKTLKAIGLALFIIFILSFFLQLISYIITNIKSKKKNLFQLQKELFLILSISLFFGFLLYFGYVTIINRFVSNTLYIYFHALQIHIFPIILVIISSYIFAHSLMKYYYKEKEEK